MSVHTCFFYNDGRNSSNNNFRLLVGVFRQMGDNYRRDDWININVTRRNSCETWGCASLDLPAQVPVLAGDRIAVRLQNQCRVRCPLLPVLNITRSTSVFFTRSNVITIPVSQVMATESYTNVYLDVSASIGKLIVFDGNSTSSVLSLWADLVLKRFLLYISHLWSSGFDSFSSFLCFLLLWFSLIVTLYTAVLTSQQTSSPLSTSSPTGEMKSS